MIGRLSFLSIARRPGRHILLILLLAAACALPVFLIQMTNGLYHGLNKAVEPFPMLKGAKGSPYQLVIHTIFLRDRPIGNISYEEVEKLRESGKADQVIPLAFGDSYRGFRIVGTEPEIFRYQPNKKAAPWLTVAEGRAFEDPMEAVIGADIAKKTGLAIGDTFRSMHGVSDVGGHEHKEVLTVTGILAPVGGPYDTAILINIKDVWEEHSHKEGEPRRGGIIRPGIKKAPVSDASAEEIHREGGKGDVTAVLIHPKGYKEAMQLLSAAQRDKDSQTQLVFPSQTLISLYSMAGQSKEFWQYLTGGMIGAAILITLLAMYWNGLSRLSEFALLRALGAGSAIVMKLLAAEEAILLASGAVLGWLIGWGGSVLAAVSIAGKAAIVLPTAPEALSFLPPIVIFSLGLAAGLIPSWMVRKKDVSRYL